MTANTPDTRSPGLVEAELKSCPFCGGEAQPALIQAGGIEWAQVECIDPDCGACGPAPATEAEAIAAWNTRTSSPPGDEGHTLALLVEALEAIHAHGAASSAIREICRAALRTSVPASEGQVEAVLERALTLEDAEIVVRSAVGPTNHDAFKRVAAAIAAMLPRGEGQVEAVADGALVERLCEIYEQTTGDRPKSAGIFQVARAAMLPAQQGWREGVEAAAKVAETFPSPLKNAKRAIAAAIRALPAPPEGDEV